MAARIAVASIGGRHGDEHLLQSRIGRIRLATRRRSGYGPDFHDLRREAY